jgi:hypothetical protein
MKTSSAKGKGRRLQSEMRDVILTHFPELEPDDVKCAVMGESGEDLKLSPAARRKFKYSVECKNQEKISIWAAIKQSEDNVKPGCDPLLVFRRNHSRAYVTLSLENFIKLIPKESTKVLLNEEV